MHTNFTVLPDKVVLKALHGTRGIVVDIGENVDCDILVEGDIVVFDPDMVMWLDYEYIAVDIKSVFAIDEKATLEYEPDWEEEKRSYPSEDGEEPQARDIIFVEIDEERLYQDRVYGGADFDDSLEEKHWLKFISEYANGVGRAEDYDFRTRMVKTAALCVAAVESFDRTDG